MIYPEKVRCRSDIIAVVRHPDKIERWPDRIPHVRHPGGMNENFRPDGMSDAMCRKGKGVTRHFLGKIPHHREDRIA